MVTRVVPCMAVLGGTIWYHCRKRACFRGPPASLPQDRLDWMAHLLAAQQLLNRRNPTMRHLVQSA